MVDASPEQAEAMKEKLKNMSPEELKEFQKQRCIFCQIISGKVASKKIFSDDECTAILDINPANPGHVLLIPNEHYSIMPLIPPETIKHLFMVAKALAQASLKALETQGANIFVANGLAAGQKAQHFMIHIIPRKEGDNLQLNIPENKISGEDMKQVVDRLAPVISKALGGAAPVKAAEEKPKKKEPKTEGSKPKTEEAPADEEPEGETEEAEDEIEPEEEQEDDDSLGDVAALLTGRIEEPEENKPKPKKGKKAKNKASKKKNAGKKAKNKQEPEEEQEEEPEDEGGITLDDIGKLMTGR